jgi:hypothetical protein
VFKPGHAAQGRALAGAARAQKREELPFRNFEADILHRSHLAFVNDKALPQTLDSKHIASPQL